MLPLVLTVSAGAELHRPLAVIYIGGFFFAILLRLFVVPVLYETFARWTIRFRKHPESGTQTAV